MAEGIIFCWQGCNGDKFLKKKLRERQLRDLCNYDKPEETIKWELSKLVNTMEGRPIIGA